MGGIGFSKGGEMKKGQRLVFFFFRLGQDRQLEAPHMVL